MKTIIQPFAVLLLLLLNTVCQATMVLPVSLQRMSNSAELIFEGRVTTIDVKLDEVSKRVATFTTFAVTDVIKGQVASTHIVKQFGGQLPGSNLKTRIHGIPEFEKGKNYIVFLPPVSRLGFASPVGLSQGKFDITQRNGKTVISNGRSIQNLMHDDPHRNLRNTHTHKQLRTTNSTPLKAITGTATFTEIGSFKSTVRSMVAE